MRCARAAALNHRMGLDDGILIKDNHVRLAGGIGPALERMREASTDMPIEIEVQSFEQLDQALAAGATRILADNFSVDDLEEVVKRARGRAQIEISGGVTLSRMAELAATGADFVSVGALTHSAPAMDISFEIEPVAAGGRRAEARNRFRRTRTSKANSRLRRGGTVSFGSALVANCNGGWRRFLHPHARRDASC